MLGRPGPAPVSSSRQTLVDRRGGSVGLKAAGWIVGGGRGMRVAPIRLVSAVLIDTRSIGRVTGMRVPVALAGGPFPSRSTIFALLERLPRGRRMKPGPTPTMLTEHRPRFPADAQIGPGRSARRRRNRRNCAAGNTKVLLQRNESWTTWYSTTYSVLQPIWSRAILFPGVFFIQP
jgi:hypothetical protein